MKSGMDVPKNLREDPESRPRSNQSQCFNTVRVTERKGLNDGPTQGVPDETEDIARQ